MQTKKDKNGLKYFCDLIDIIEENSLRRELPEFEKEFEELQKEKYFNFNQQITMTSYKKKNRKISLENAFDMLNLFQKFDENNLPPGFSVNDFQEKKKFYQDIIANSIEEIDDEKAELRGINYYSSYQN